MNVLISVALCFPQRSHKCTHLTLIKKPVSLSVLCHHCMIPDFVAQRTTEGRVEQESYKDSQEIESEKRLYEYVERCYEARRTEIKKVRKEKTKRRNGRGTQRAAALRLTQQ